MTTATQSVPEPLLTVARTAALLMAAGTAGLASKGAMQYNYRLMLQRYQQPVLEVMRMVVENAASRLTLREADRSVFLGKVPRNAILVAVCDMGRPPRTVSVLRSSDRLYALYAGRGETMGIVVQRAQAKGGV